MKHLLTAITSISFALSATAATITTFTGGDIGDGLDLSDDYIYAVNVAGHTQYPPTIQGITFINDTLVSGVTVTLGGSSNYRQIWWLTQPSYDSGVGNDYQLGAGLMHSTALSAGTDPSIAVALDVTAGATYELQLFFSENYYSTANARHFDIAVEGVTIVDEFTTTPVGAEWTTTPHTGVLVTYQMTAADSVINVNLTEGSSGDTNPILQAVTLEEVPPSAYYVSPTGNDTGLGTLADPFKTIARACQLAQPGITVYLRAGEYQESLAPTTSGSAGNPITFTNYNNETVVLVSGQQLSGWTAVGDGSYQAASTIDLGAGMNQLICNGDLMIEARYPNIDSKEELPFVFKTKKTLPTYFHQQASYTYDPTDYIEIYAGGDMAETTGSAWYVGLHNQAWSTQVASVDYSNPGALSINYKTVVECFFGEGAGYVVGAPEYLDHQSEWFLNTNNAEIHFIPPTGVDPNTATIYLKDSHAAIDLSDKQYIVVDGLNTWMGSVNMTNSQDCTVRNSSHLYGGHHTFVDNIYGQHREVENTIWYSTGFFVSGSNNAIERCEVAYNAGASIMMTGEDHKVSNSRIHDSGLLGSYASGIFFLSDFTDSEQLGGHEVFANTIYNVGRSAINIASDGTWANPGVYASPLTITYNYIANAMLIADDGGAIYDFATDGNGTEIAYNVVRDTYSSGIYLDNYSRGFDVHHNVVYQMDGNHIRVNGPGNERVTITNNTLIDPNFFPNDGIVGNGDILVCDNITSTYGIHPADVEFASTGTGGAEFQPLYASQVPQAFCGGPIGTHTRLAYSGAFAPVGVGTPWVAGADWGGSIPQIKQASNQQLWASDFSNASGFEDNSGYVVSQAQSAWLSYAGIDCGLGYSQLVFRAIVDASNGGGTVEVRTGSASGTLLGSTSLTANSDDSVFEYRSIELSSAQGIQDLYLVCNAASGVLIMDAVLIGPEGQMSHLLPSPNGGRVLNMRASTFRKGMWWQDNVIRRTFLDDWIYFPKVDFGVLCNEAFIELSLNDGGEGGVIEFRSGSLDGPLLGQHSPYGNGTTLGENYTEQAFSLNNVSGVHDLFIVFRDANCGNIRSLRLLPSIAATSIAGGDAGDGLGLSGDYEYMIDIGGGTASRTIQGYTFTADASTTGANVTLSGGGVYAANWGNKPEYGSSSSDDHLELMMQNTALAYAGTPSIAVDLDVSAGDYELTLLFSENAYNGSAGRRYLDVTVEGATVISNLDTLNGESWTGSSADVITALTYTLTMDNLDQVINIVVDGGSTAGDHNPILQGLMLKKTSPLSISSFIGGDIGEGIELSGNYTYLVDVGGATASRTIQGYTFTADDTTTGVTTTLTGAGTLAGNWGTVPSYGSSTSDDGLEQMMLNTALAYGGTPSIAVDLDVTAGEVYELSLFFSENGYDGSSARRYLDVFIEGVLIQADLDTLNAESWTASNPDVGVVLTYKLTASDNVLSIDMLGGVLPGDHNPILQGLALREVD